MVTAVENAETDFNGCPASLDLQDLTIKIENNKLPIIQKIIDNASNFAVFVLLTIVRCAKKTKSFRLTWFSTNAKIGTT